MITTTNLSASSVAHNLGVANQRHQKNLERLSSGLRINSSSDDAAGLAVSTKMSATVRRNDSYGLNVHNALSFLQTQDGALSQLGNLLERMSELKTLAHDATKSADDVLLYEAEYVELQEQFKKTVTEEFNEIRLFSPDSKVEHLFLPHPEHGGAIQISRPSLGDLRVGQSLSVGKTKSEVTTTNKNYEFISGTFTWHQAKLDAQGRGGHLATVGSASEWDQIKPLASGHTVWLGATDESIEGVWEWIDGTPFSFQTWGPGQPDNAKNGNPLLVQHYLASQPNLLWNDWQNDEASGDYILEKTTQTTTVTESHLSIRDLPWSDLIATIINVAQARAQNGAEQMQLRMAADLNAVNTINLQQALSRIQDADISQVISDFSRTKALIEAGATISSQAKAAYESILLRIYSGGP